MFAPEPHATNGKLVPPTVALPEAKSPPTCVPFTPSELPGLHGLHLAGPQFPRYIPPDTEKSGPLKLKSPMENPLKVIVPLVMGIALARNGNSAKRAEVSSSFMNLSPGSVYWKF